MFKRILISSALLCLLLSCSSNMKNNKLNNSLKKDTTPSIHEHNIPDFVL
jgi:hypothetical protein